MHLLLSLDYRFCPIGEASFLVIKSRSRVRLKRSLAIGYS